MNWYLKVLRQYADFNGRARREEYWMFTLFNLIFIIVAMILDNILGLTVEEEPYGVFYFLYAFAVLIPGLAVTVRRLHDVGKSGWMILVALIPIIGAIWLLALMVFDSDPGDNEYGQNPKGVTSEQNEEQFIQELIEKSGGEAEPIIIIDKCPACGKKISDNDKTCPDCGLSLI
jgi:uncharacterized membrane protein YhaH (DUF805 family)